VGLIIAAHKVVAAVSKVEVLSAQIANPACQALCWHWRPNGWRQLRIFEASSLAVCSLARIRKMSRWNATAATQNCVA